MKILLDRFKNYSVVSKFISTGNGSLYEYNLKYTNHDDASKFAHEEASKYNFELIEKEWK